jgi:TetR/AcrR family transcriptional regulator, lmrAB and yxaGH operons repressor
VQRYAAAILARITAVTEQGSSVDAVRVFIEVVRDGLRASDFHHGCAVAAIVLDATPADAALLDLSSTALRGWRQRFAVVFRRDGATEAQARRLANLVVSAVEGALILARADRDVAPVTDVGHELEAHIRRLL